MMRLNNNTLAISTGRTVLVVVVGVVVGVVDAFAP